MLKISVIIPIYNVEKYLSECLCSVINQTFQDFEIICIDDCGNDGSMQIAQEYAGKCERIKIVHHDKNKGLGAARNTGIFAARGEYIFFLDSDDYILPDTLQKLYEKAVETKSDITVVQAEAFADDDSHETNKRVGDVNKYLNRLIIDNYKVKKENFIKSSEELNCTAWGKLYKTEFIKNNNLRFIEQNVLHEDNGFWLKVCSCFPDITYIGYKGLMYRMRQGAITDIINKRKQHKKKKKHLKLNMLDAFSYIGKYRQEYAKDLINQIKNSSIYCSFFEIRLWFLFRLRWTPDDKMLSIFGLPLYREKIKNGKKIYRFLGINVEWCMLFK